MLENGVLLHIHHCSHCCELLSMNLTILSEYSVIFSENISKELKSRHEQSGCLSGNSGYVVYTVNKDRSLYLDCICGQPGVRILDDDGQRTCFWNSVGN